MRFLGAVLALALGGCTSAAEPELALASGVVGSVGSSGNENPEPVSPLRSAPVSVTWTDIRSSASCFFFSGPLDLGRDDHLGERASVTLRPPHAELVFDEGRLRFVGRTVGGTLALGREAPHEYGGTWMTRESLLLTASGDAWVGRYHYDEVDPATGAPSSCHIDATVVLAPSP